MCSQEGEGDPAAACSPCHGGSRKRDVIAILWELVGRKVTELRVARPSAGRGWLSLVSVVLCDSYSSCPRGRCGWRSCTRRGPAVLLGCEAGSQRLAVRDKGSTAHVE